VVPGLWAFDLKHYCRRLTAALDHTAFLTSAPPRARLLMVLVPLSGGDGGGGGDAKRARLDPSTGRLNINLKLRVELALEKNVPTCVCCLAAIHLSL
jgi:hypothetical protein